MKSLFKAFNAIVTFRAIWLAVALLFLLSMFFTSCATDKAGVYHSLVNIDQSEVEDDYSRVPKEQVVYNLKDLQYDSAVVRQEEPWIDMIHVDLVAKNGYIYAILAAERHSEGIYMINVKYLYTSKELSRLNEQLRKAQWKSRL
jgi:hypothetical protein